MELGEGRDFDNRGPHPYNIRQYMSYEIQHRFNPFKEMLPFDAAR